MGGALSVALVDDGEIRRVHREFLKDDRATDVIAFSYGAPPSHDPPISSSQASSLKPQAAGESGPFGEIVVSAECALREARRRGIEPQEELERYAIHGLLHLLGHDDRTPGERRRMRALERRYLAAFRQ